MRKRRGPPGHLVLSAAASGAYFAPHGLSFELADLRPPRIDIGLFRQCPQLPGAGGGEVARILHEQRRALLTLLRVFLRLDEAFQNIGVPRHDALL